VCDNHNITLHRTYCHCRCVVQFFAVVILFFNYFGAQFFQCRGSLYCNTSSDLCSLRFNKYRYQEVPTDSSEADPDISMRGPRFFFLENNWISKQLVLRKIKSENYKT